MASGNMDELTPTTNETEEDSEIKGDTIGNTAYSERFVLNILIKIATLDKLEEEDLKNYIESELCVLWDMTTEKDVSEFLLCQNAMEIFCELLGNQENVRLVEVTIGILANMCSHQKVIQEVNKKDFIRKHVLEYMASEDSLILVQVLRFIFSNIYYNSTHLESWLDFLAENEFPSAINYLLTNSLNQEILINTFETVNCICSSFEETDNALFLKMFVSEDFIKSLLTGFEELSKLVVESKENRERCDLVFLSIHSILTNFESQSMAAYKSVKSNFIKIVNEIFTKCTKSDDIILDIVQYITAGHYIINDLSIKESKNILHIMLELWIKTVDSKDTEGSDFHGSLEVNELEDILPQYFVRTFQSLTSAELKILLENTEQKYVTALSSKIHNLIESKSLDKYFSSIPIVLDDLQQ